MAIELPPPITAYFESDRGDGIPVSECFTDDAKVKDEGNTYSGRDAILEWKAESSSKYKYTTEPFAIGEAGGEIVVTACVAGDFPGSPVDLRYFFVLEGDKIASLEIKL